MTYIINNQAITLLLSGNRNLRVEKTDRCYPKILKCFELPKEEQEAAVLAVIEPEVVTVESVKGRDGFEVITDEYGYEEVYYQNQPLPNALKEKVLSIIRDGLSLEHFAKFWDNLQLNPSQSSVNELVDFLEYKELPITDDGHFIAYKGVQQDYFSCHGNTKTVVVSGEVDYSGRILNKIGSTIEVLRRCVNDNRSLGCESGLHVGSLDYARGFSSRILIVKVNPRDVVSVPSDCSYQKCRVCKYEVLSEFTEEILSSVVDEDGEETIVPNELKERSTFVDRLENYLRGKELAGFEEITVRQIQNSFSPDYPSREEILDALQELYYSWHDDDGILTVELQ